MSNKDGEEIQDAKANEQKKNVVNNGDIKAKTMPHMTLNPVIVELWEDYKKAVENYGYGIEAKEVLIKINSLAPKE
jgi:hypothetical protein